MRPSQRRQDSPRKRGQGRPGQHSRHRNRRVWGREVGLLHIEGRLRDQAGTSTKAASLDFRLPRGGFWAALLFALSGAALELTSLMQNVIVDTIDGLYAAGQSSVGLRLGFNGVLLLRKPAAIHCGVCPVLGRLGRGRLSGRPFPAISFAFLSIDSAPQ